MVPLSRALSQFADSEDDPKSGTVIRLWQDDRLRSTAAPNPAFVVVKQAEPIVFNLILAVALFEPISGPDQ